MANSKNIAGFLIILHPPELAGKIPFFYGNNIIGRSANKATLVVKEVSISQKHATLFAAPGRITITDLGSKNGTKINGEDNLIEQGKQVVADESMVIYFAEVKCKIEFNKVVDQKKEVKEADKLIVKGEKSKKRQEMMQMFQELSRSDVKNPQQEEGIKEKGEVKPVKDEYKKPAVTDDFDIEEGFTKIESKQADKQKQIKGKASKSLQYKQNQLRNAMEDKNKKGKTNPKKEKKEQKQVKIDKTEKQSEVQVQPIKGVKKDEKIKKEEDIKKEEEKSSKFLLKPPQSTKEPKKKSPQPNFKPKISPEKLEQKKDSPDILKKIKQKEALKKQQSMPQCRKSQRLSNQKKNQEIQRDKNKKDNLTKVERQKQQLKLGKNKEKSVNPGKSKSVSPTREEQSKNEDKKGGANQRSKNSFLSRQSEESPESKQTKIQISHSTKKKDNRKKKPSQSLQQQIKLSTCSQMVLYPRRSFVGKRILCSAFHPQLKRKYFLNVENVNEEFDFLVMKTYMRTFKALVAICRGIPIVSFNWVQESQDYEKVLRPNCYYFKQVNFVYQAIDRVKSGQKLFEGYQFNLASKDYHMKMSEIELLIKMTGGSILKKYKDFKDKKGRTAIALVMNKQESKAIQYQADIKNALRQGFEYIYTLQFLLDCCQKQRIDLESNNVSKLFL